MNEIIRLLRLAWLHLKLWYLERESWEYLIQGSVLTQDEIDGFHAIRKRVLETQLDIKAVRHGG
jgi:hypothetical protein